MAVDAPSRTARSVLRDAIRDELAPDPDLCLGLIAETREAAFSDPQAAVRWGRLAVETADRLAALPEAERKDRGGFPAALDLNCTLTPADLSAQAWSALGNAHRVAADLGAAERAFARAEELLERGCGSPCERARWLYERASLRTDQRRFEDAERDLRWVIATYSGDPPGKPAYIPDEHLLGKALVKLGFTLGTAGRVAAAVRLHRRALPLLDARRDLRLLVAALHNLVHLLDDLGYTVAALEMLQEIRPLHERLDDRWARQGLTWLEGKIKASLGCYRQAEAALLQVRDAYLEAGQDYDVALVSLDLALVYVQEHRPLKMRRLAEEMFPIFQSRKLHQEALAALLVFREAASLKTMSEGVIGEVLTFLHQARRNPGLRFKPKL